MGTTRSAGSLSIGRRSASSVMSQSERDERGVILGHRGRKHCPPVDSFMDPVNRLRSFLLFFVAQLAPQYFAHIALGQLSAELHQARHLVSGQMFLAVGDHV